MEMLLPISMAVLTLGTILIGYRVAFVLAGSAAIFIVVGGLPSAFFNLIISRIYANVLTNWLLVAIPMFIFMGLILERSGVAERALKAAQTALGGSRAGMGISVLLVSVLLAASSGIVGASVVLLTLLALPRLLETGFDKPTSAGLVASSGTLAILIPPSVMLIVLGDQLQAPIPDMFAGAIGPGLLLVLLYGGYIIFKSRQIEHNKAKARLGVSPISLLLDIGPLILLVICVLGSIIAGLATPTEASGLGAFGAILITLIYGRFKMSVILEAAKDTVVATSMVMMVMVGATCFSAVFRGIGGDELIQDGILAFGGSPWVVLAVVMTVIFILGFVLDWLEITLILMPIFAPIIAGLDFGNGLDAGAVMVWFGILVAVNLQTSFLTPPFGFSLFYLKGAAKSQLATSDIYQGVIPFIILQIFALGLLIAFPKIIVGF
jgi:tripartite ATP-independent transporter DctM subunit